MSMGPAAAVHSTGAEESTLRKHLLRADPGVLVAVLAQMTGDASVIDRYGAKIDHVPDPPERAGRTDPGTAEALADEILAALGARAPGGAAAAVDRELFVKLLPIALGTDVDDEQVDLLLEQGGFRPSQPTLPRTEPIPSMTTMAIIGAGIAGIAVALAAAEEGVRFEIFDRNDDVGGTWLTTTYPGIGVDHAVGLLLAVAGREPGLVELLPDRRGVPGVSGGAGRQARPASAHSGSAQRWKPCGGTSSARSGRSHSRSADGTRSIDHARIVVTAAGYLNRPRFPELTGRDSFSGVSVHSAQWTRR